MKSFHRRLVTFTLCAGILATLPAAYAQDQKKTDDAQKQPAEKPIPPEKTSVTHHELTLNGKTLHYTATAGTLLIRDDKEEKPYGSIFYVAYTLDGAEAKSRPVTFLYNGGPGSATLWLHMGSVGPMRVVTDSPKATGPAPYQIVPNQYSLLDKTDLVFIDAPLTGYSRAVGKGTVKDFAGVDQDLKAFHKFIARYITVNQRWNSPKVLFGESYGTTRSAGLSDVLEDNGISLNGVILLSSILNYNSLSPGLDLQYINNLPSYAAIAWYHNKLQNKPAQLAPFLEEVRTFARGEYSEALAEGDQLPQAKLDAIATKVSQYTGLSVEYVKNAKLRISPFRYRKELLRSEGDIMGRYDARFEGTDVDNAGEYPGYDPSDTGISGAFIAAEHEYLENDLKYETDDEYKPSAETIGEWDWKHRGAGSYRGYGREQQMPYVAGDLADAMRKDPKLKVFSANGYFDLATPFFATEYDLDHMMLTPELAKNVKFGYYPSGHMVYLNVDALKQLVHDLDQFYSSLAM
ncbi:S10 family peptidase [Acidipila rosea]|uniref:Carboxypeptidase C (Cathepsin A) n=1 Tax=Acidipila rosea TaxID=768535 RepID=A0A4R1L696_9BACT|nr:peptidase S10 [Acidipila rosea]TCK73686.1 carboxypeptidase C (cathepsin A) [Acidipila rosea]